MRVTKTSWMSRISRECGGDAAEADFEPGDCVRVRRAARWLQGSDSMWVRMEEINRDIAAHLGLVLGDEGGGGDERHGLVDFQMLFYMKACGVQRVVELLDGDVVDSEIGTGSDGADAVVDSTSAMEAEGTEWTTTSAPGRWR